MEAGTVLFEKGAPVTHVVFPQSGVISIIEEMPDGRAVEKLSIGPEGFVGFTLIMGGGTSLGKNVVQVKCSALWVSMDDLDIALERYECVREAMLRYAKSLIVQLMESVACRSLHTASQRVSRWIMHAHDRVHGEIFHLTQESIANLLALRRATVNAVCSELMNAGAISYQRGNLIVADRALLRAHCCDCYDRIQAATLR